MRDKFSAIGSSISDETIAEKNYAIITYDEPFFDNDEYT